MKQSTARPHRTWLTQRLPAILSLALLAASLPVNVATAQDPDQNRSNHKEAVKNLKAYAVYKAGNYDQARQMWEELAAKGNTTALVNLANLFQQGQGVTEDQKKAMTYVKKAAELGDARAQYELGIAYEKGTILERNIESAAGWLKKAALQDYADGQFAYGVMLATSYGKGIEKATDKERSEALEWLAKAKANGNLEASDYIKVLTAPAG
ncbi:MAG: sel1 repeat family protein [Alphaproteobacteria bacterium]|nr:sel1 repeat family protein [Alphaproteobacteria bacterium]